MRKKFSGPVLTLVISMVALLAFVGCTEVKEVPTEVVVTQEVVKEVPVEVVVEKEVIKEVIKTVEVPKEIVVQRSRQGSSSDHY